MKFEAMSAGRKGHKKADEADVDGLGPNAGLPCDPAHNGFSKFENTGPYSVCASPYYNFYLVHRQSHTFLLMCNPR